MTHSSRRLTPRQMTVFALCGVAAWLAAALLLRLLGPLGAYDGGSRFVLYVLIIPGTIPVVWLVGRLANAAPGQLFVGFAIGSAVATLCDGIALAWFPRLYGGEIALHAGAGGTILWGVGVGLILAYVMDREAPSLESS